MRRLLVPLLAASLLGVPAVASAAPEHCPQAVKDVRGTNPSAAALSAALDTAAAASHVPAPVLRAIAYVESGWRQYASDGSPLISVGDAVCGLGIMQVTADAYSEENQVRLASDYVYNIDEGARILAEKWAVSAGTPPPTGASPDSPDVIENWYYAICLYNGCGSDPTYPDKVANVVADPFRYAPNFPVLRPYWFTKPQDADPTYVFPNAFQARYTPSREFVFYDHTTGTPTKPPVAAPTHSLAATAPPTTTYPAGLAGPDGARVTCSQCGGWRLAGGTGVIGRAHWTNTVSGANQSSITWLPPASGRYRVAVHVPTLGDRTLGSATYKVDWATVTIDQNAKKGGWVELGTYYVSPNNGVFLGDAAQVSGLPIVADAVRFSSVTSLAIDFTLWWPTYGQRTGVRTQLREYNRGVAGQTVRYYRRPLGRTAWTYVGSARTDRSGTAILSATGSVNVEYQARFVPTTAAYVASTSRTRPLYVIPVVGTAYSDTDVRRGTAVAVSTVVRPAHSGYRVYLQRASTTSGWLTVASTLLNSTGNARFRFTRSSPGTFYYRVYLPKHADHLAGYSRTQSVRFT